jgi:ferrous iron transport protein B
MKNEIKIAFAGNPNTGKTALINAISGASLKVGNWPGVTVEKKEAEFTYKSRRIKVIDLPGIYSLNPYSMEEKVTRDFLIFEKPDIIVNVIDSTNLERNLFLTTQLMEFNIPIIICLNMWDEFLKKGYKLDVEKFEKMINIKIVTTVATKNKGIDNLLSSIDNIYDNKKIPTPIKFSQSIEKFISDISIQLKNDTYPKRWVAIKLLENDDYFPEKTVLNDEINRIKKEFMNFYGEDSETIISENRYGVVKGLVKETMKYHLKKKRLFTNFLDSIFLNRVLGIPIFIFFMYLVFKLTFDGSAPFIDWTDGFINGFIGKWISHSIISTPDWFQSLIIDGIIGGVGLVLTFVPLMFFLYFFLAILEHSGYMARAAFVADRIMRSFGLHGKSFMPMLVGFGCNVPAIYATRTLDSEKERKLTALLIPFMSCGARLPIYALFTSVFFKKFQVEVVLSMYLIGIGVAILAGFILKKTIFIEKTPAFILELPPYRVPTLRMLWNSIWLRTRAFVKKAGTVILVTMVLLWAFLNLPYGAKPENTLLGKSAQVISPIFKPCGFGKWQAVSALIPGIIAKEAVIGALGQAYDIKDDNSESAESTFFSDLGKQVKAFFVALKESIVAMFGSIRPGVFNIEDEKSALSVNLQNDFTPLSAFSYMIFCLLCIPCVVTLAAIYHEFGWKMVGYSMILTTVVPYFASIFVYNFGKFLGY